MRGVIVGDVHAKVEELDDCERLAEVVRSVCKEEEPTFLVFLGDLYDAFALKNVQVERWWMSFLDSISIYKYLLVGNHDRPGDSTQEAHSLQAHRKQACVVDKPIVMFGPDILFIPFYFKAEDFVKVCNEPAYSKAKTVFCHQSFLGGKYESGLPIEARHDASAVDSAAIPQRCVVAGHIHTSQNIGKVWYPGAPRWRNNVSDANLERYVYAIDFKDGLPSSIRKYPTGAACKRIWKVDVTPERVSVPLELGKEGDRWVVDITGPSNFIEQAKKDWTRPGTRIRSFQTDRPGPKLSEAQGIKVALDKWQKEYQPKYGTAPEILSAMIRERINV